MRGEEHKVRRSSDPRNNEQTALELEKGKKQKTKMTACERTRMKQQKRNTMGRPGCN